MQFKIFTVAYALRGYCTAMEDALGMRWDAHWLLAGVRPGWGRASPEAAGRYPSVSLGFLGLLSDRGGHQNLGDPSAQRRVPRH